MHSRVCVGRWVLLECEKDQGRRFEVDAAAAEARSSPECVVVVLAPRIDSASRTVIPTVLRQFLWSHYYYYYYYYYSRMQTN